MSTTEELTVSEWLRIAADRCCQCTDGHCDHPSRPFGTDSDVRMSRDLAREIADMIERTEKAEAEVERLAKSVGAFSSARDTAKKGWQSLKERLADPWDLEGNAAATAWKARVTAVEKWAEDEYGDTTDFPTGLVMALFGSVAAELHEVGASDDGS